MSHGYEDDVTVRQCWDALSGSEDAFLIDVRTGAEWNYVGFPLVSGAASPLFIEWLTFPTMTVNAAFAEQVSAEVLRRGGSKQSKLYFLCRSGVRSIAGAIAATQAGFEHSYNVLDGFEGPADTDGHRGNIAGWKAAGLPWVQK
ncbi:rhodanese-like domain-containing protein [Aureimonas fodinaquatilis]|uniref:Rhodanese-like domain-containing protein n=1 Tax=Aureimonas fodinaquatilis TaxID=2565783 RepID=A0A5B0DY24_9HYPH|nr:rhodanese-like domain-containing protein [Aureimonas fodinaquatilis]KAA0971674.1 rhodanese-like domain-containing protein [Aureimonas fodinaquatilis]